MVDQNLRYLPIFFDRHLHVQKALRIQQILISRCGRMHAVKILHQIIEVFQLFVDKRWREGVLCHNLLRHRYRFSCSFRRFILYCLFPIFFPAVCHQSFIRRILSIPVTAISLSCLRKQMPDQLDSSYFQHALYPLGNRFMVINNHHSQYKPYSHPSYGYPFRPKCSSEQIPSMFHVPAHSDFLHQVYA